VHEQVDENTGMKAAISGNVDCLRGLSGGLVSLRKPFKRSAIPRGFSLCALSPGMRS
jgi:hypothetical protein